ncbi:MAG: hypothetical protein LBV71_11215 [Prevotella sp.]|jgi:hypothetical protein|nr:hypothetical protein [Prevotella sp.]
MTTKLTLLLTNLFLILGGLINLSGQVTIGNEKEPLDISVLELISENTSGPKGFRLPQLSTAEISVLTSNINQLPTTEKTRADGMVIFNTTTGCVMVWNGKEFKSLCGDIGPAEATFDCTQFRVFPNGGEPDYIPTNYRQGTPLDGSASYITVPATVTKAGTYNIIATTGNGYSFSTNGTFLDVGSYLLKLAGAGTPIMGGTTYSDQLNFSFNDENVILGCDPASLPKIPVAPAIDKATYTINCASTTISGNYIINSDLNSTHYITVQVDVTGHGNYTFTAEAAGMHFSRSGQWPAGTTGLQTVTLLSSGKPTQAGTLPITITGETAGADVTCDKNITVSYRSMKILGFGWGTYQPATATTVQSSRAILESSANFGSNGTFPTQNITIADAGYTTGTVAARINSNNPDIIVIGYNFHTNATDNAALVDFVQNKKGVLIAMTQDNGVADAAMINAICGSSVTMSYGGGGGALYMFPNIDNTLLNGPFGDVRGKYWGDDAGTTFRVNSIPAGATSLSSNGEIFVYNNFLWIGDGGFSAGDRATPSTTIWPCTNDNQGRPTPKYPYGSPAQTVYNSAFYANAMAWAIKYVQENK